MYDSIESQYCGTSPPPTLILDSLESGHIVFQSSSKRMDFLMNNIFVILSSYWLLNVCSYCLLDGWKFRIHKIFHCYLWNLFIVTTTRQTLLDSLFHSSRNTSQEFLSKHTILETVRYFEQIDRTDICILFSLVENRNHFKKKNWVFFVIIL
jgi:hypothetical protein